MTGRRRSILIQYYELNVSFFVQLLTVKVPEVGLVRSQSDQGWLIVSKLPAALSCSWHRDLFRILRSTGGQIGIETSASYCLTMVMSSAGIYFFTVRTRYANPTRGSIKDARPDADMAG